LLSSNSGTICLISGAPDNVPIVLLAEFLVKKDNTMTVDKALDILKQRRIQADPHRNFIDCIEPKKKIALTTQPV
jgi:hypothetical protein